MKTIRTFVPNSFANYNHLLFCPETRETAAIDPFSAEHLLNIAQQHQLSITQIWLTHEHGDHIRELEELKSSTQAQVSAPKSCRGLFSADIWLEDQQELTLGQSQCKHYLSPGHTPGHGVYVVEDINSPDDNAIICGDTLFNAGVGNVKSGNVEELYSTVERLQSLLPANASIYNGHDYIVTNLKFVLHHFPQCQAAQDTLAQVERQTPQTRSVQRLNEERHYNPFLALNAPWLTANPVFTDLSEKARFLKLRELRDAW